MAKPICSLVVLNLKDITRIVGNSILPPKRSGLVVFQTINQVKAALRLQENRQIEIKSDIPVEITKELNPNFVEPIPVVEEVQPEPIPVVEDSAPDQDVQEQVEEDSDSSAKAAKPKRNRKNTPSEQ